MKLKMWDKFLPNIIVTHKPNTTRFTPWYVSIVITMHSGHEWVKI